MWKYVDVTECENMLIYDDDDENMLILRICWLMLLSEYYKEMLFNGFYTDYEIYKRFLLVRFSFQKIYYYFK